MGDLLPAVALGVGKTANAIVTGDAHTCVRLTDGSVKCWGYNLYGQLGLGDGTNRGSLAAAMGDTLPTVKLGMGKTAKILAAGAYHTCAVLNDDALKCWGFNTYGQLGAGDTTTRGLAAVQMGDSLLPVALGTGKTAKAVTAGDGHTCALLSDDGIKCWGRNADGQLGLGDTANRGNGVGKMGDDLPLVALGAGTTQKAVVAGDFHNCALSSNGAVKCWGKNANGQLGLGDAATRGDGVGKMGDDLPLVSLSAP